MNLKLFKNKKILVVVAHPDDEIIWLGGTIMKYGNKNWTILSLCRANDRDRAPKFRKVCELYGLIGLIDTLDDEGVLAMGESIHRAEKIILDQVAKDYFDIIITHGENGEYGHERHITAYRAINNLIRKKKIKPEAVLFFNYEKRISGQKIVMNAKGNSDLFLDLSAKQFAEKQRVVAELYGYPHEGIDVGLCTNPEAFKIFIPQAF